MRKKMDPDPVVRGTDPNPHQNVPDPNTASSSILSSPKYRDDFNQYFYT